MRLGQALVDPASKWGRQLELRVGQLFPLTEQI